MTRITGICIVFALIATVVCAQAPKAAISKTVDKIAVDGELNEKSWRHANTYQIDWIFGGDQNAKESKRPRGTIKYTWDENYLYIGYQVFDENLVNVPSGEKQGPKDNQREGLDKYSKEIKLDFAMFMISLGDKNFIWELNHNASNNFEDIWVVVPEKTWPLYRSTQGGKNHIVESKAEYIKDHREIDWDTGEEGVFTFAKAAKPMKNSTISQDNSKPDNDKGYVGELRIPWWGLGADTNRKSGFNFKMDGAEIRILAMVCNGDLSTPYHASAMLERGFAHKQVENWQNFVFRK